MGESVRMTMMGSFQIYIGERRVENPVSKSRKGTALVEFLVALPFKLKPYKYVILINIVTNVAMNLILSLLRMIMSQYLPLWSNREKSLPEVLNPTPRNTGK